MGKWLCKCGNAMNDHRCPDENTYWVFSDTVWDQIPVDEDGNTNYYKDIPDPTYDVYVCPVCGRLSVFGDSNIAKFYKPDND